MRPVYVCEVWDYNKENFAVSNLQWNRTFENLSVDEKVELLNETWNIFLNYIANKKIKCDYCQSPWISGNIKKSSKQRSKLTKIFYKNGQRNSDHIKVLENSEECTSLFLKLKRTIFLKWPPKLKILIQLQKYIVPY